MYFNIIRHLPYICIYFFNFFLSLSINVKYILFIHFFNSSPNIYILFIYFIRHLTYIYVIYLFYSSLNMYIYIYITQVVQRDTFANLFHDSEDFVNAFLAMAILRKPLGDTEVWLTDLYPKGPFW